MLKKYKRNFKSKFYSALDNTILFLVKLWRWSMDNQIDIDNFDPDLSRKIDMALDSGWIKNHKKYDCEVV